MLKVMLLVSALSIKESVSFFPAIFASLTVPSGSVISVDLKANALGRLITAVLFVSVCGRTIFIVAIRFSFFVLGSTT